MIGGAKEENVCVPVVVQHESRFVPTNNDQIKIIDPFQILLISFFLSFQVIHHDLGVVPEGICQEEHFLVEAPELLQHREYYKTHISANGVAEKIEEAYALNHRRYICSDFERQRA